MFSVLENDFGWSSEFWYTFALREISLGSAWDFVDIQRYGFFTQR